MRRVALTLAVFAAFATPADARPHARPGQGYAHACPMGTAANDGCTGAPIANAYTTQHPDFFTRYATQSAQIYPWAALQAIKYNVAGVHYPVGPDAMQARFFGQPGGVADPSVQSRWTTIGNAAGVTCTVGTGAGANNVACNTAGQTGPLVIDGVDWSGKGNSSTHSYSLYIYGGGNYGCVLTNNNFEFDSGIGQADPALLPRDILRQFPIYADSGCTSLDVEKNRFFTVFDDGTNGVWLSTQGSSAYIGSSALDSNHGGVYKSRYNSFVNGGTRFVQITSNSAQTIVPSSIDVAFDYYEAIQAIYTAAAVGHGDLYVIVLPNGMTLPSVSYQYITVLQPPYVKDNTTGVSVIVNQGLFASVTAHTIAGSSTGSFCIDTNPSGSGVPLGTYFSDSQQYIPGGSGWNKGFYTVGQAGQVTGCFDMNIDPGVSISSATFGVYGAARVSNLTLNYNTVVANPTSSASGDGAGNRTFGNGLFWIGYGIYANVTATGNLLDPTGASNCFGVDAPSVGALTLSGNINLTDASTVTSPAASSCHNHH